MPPQPCPSCCCAAGVCCRKGGSREKALAAMLHEHGETLAVASGFKEDQIGMDIYESMAVAIYAHFDLVPKGVGAAIVAGFEPYFLEMHEKQAKGQLEE